MRRENKGTRREKWPNGRWKEEREKKEKSGGGGGKAYKAGVVGSIPGRGTKIPHALEQLNSCTATTELVCLDHRVCAP